MQIISILMIIVLGSIALIGQGTVMLFKENSRVNLVREFNTRYKAYEETTVPKMENAVMELDDIAVIGVMKDPIVIQGSTGWHCGKGPAIYNMEGESLS